MFHAITRIGVACALTLGVAATVSAQSAQANANAQPKNQKRHPNQVPDHGIDDPALPAATTQFDRAVEAVPVTVRADGATVVELNDSFMEAATATVDAAGSLRFDHFTGVERAANFVAGQAVAASASLPARILPLA